MKVFKGALEFVFSIPVFTIMAVCAIKFVDSIVWTVFVIMPVVVILGVLIGISWVANAIGRIGT